jgi:hypothetical protein
MMHKIFCREDYMKLRVGSFVLVGVIGVMLSGVAQAGVNDPVIQKREINQQQRIQQGVDSGRLTPREAGRLETQQARIRQRETRMKADGRLTARERNSLTRQQNRANRNIYRKKHNLRHASLN